MSGQRFVADFQDDGTLTVRWAGLKRRTFTAVDRVSLHMEIDVADRARLPAAFRQKHFEPSPPGVAWMQRDNGKFVHRVSIDVLLEKCGGVLGKRIRALDEDKG